MANLLARFYGGSLDGQSKEYRGGARILASPDCGLTCETYERDHEHDVRDSDGQRTELAFKLAKTEDMSHVFKEPDNG